MRKTVAALFVCALSLPLAGREVQQHISLKNPGNPSVTYMLHPDMAGSLKASVELPVEITRTQIDREGISEIEVTVRAKEQVYFSYGEVQKLGIPHDSCLFYMPGFW
ncbi:MAG: hypothetical protein J6B62_09960, partial [Bacteroidales bacterium]|nr:hypothetical protein [Bacteroidales bacterium]